MKLSPMQVGFESEKNAKAKGRDVEMPV